MSYFKVVMVRGHQGTRCNKNLITFYYQAESAMAAMKRAQAQPGVKHTRLPVMLTEVDKSEYEYMIQFSAYERAGYNMRKRG